MSNDQPKTIYDFPKDMLIKLICELQKNAIKECIKQRDIDEIEIINFLRNYCNKNNIKMDECDFCDIFRLKYNGKLIYDNETSRGHFHFCDRCGDGFCCLHKEDDLIFYEDYACDECGEDFPLEEWICIFCVNDNFIRCEDCQNVEDDLDN